MTDGPLTAGGAENDSRVGRWLTRLLEFLAAATLFSLMAMTCIDVAGRYLFNAPLIGATELTRLMMAMVIFSVLPLVSWREEHVTVDLIDQIFPRRLISLRQILINLIGAVAMSVIAWRVWILAARAAEYGDFTEYLEIPLAPFSYFMSCMSAVTAVALVLNAVRYMRGTGPMSPRGTPG